MINTCKSYTFNLEVTCLFFITRTNKMLSYFTFSQLNTKLITITVSKICLKSVIKTTFSFIHKIYNREVYVSLTYFSFLDTTGDLSSVNSRSTNKNLKFANSVLRLQLKNLMKRALITISSGRNVTAYLHNYNKFTVLIIFYKLQTITTNFYFFILYMHFRFSFK